MHYENYDINFLMNALKLRLLGTVGHIIKNQLQYENEKTWIGGKFVYKLSEHFHNKYNISNKLNDSFRWLRYIIPSINLIIQRITLIDFW